MEIRKGKQTDIDSIEQIYERIHDGEEQGLTTCGWMRHVYPTRKTAEDALKRGDLFVMVDEGKVVAVAVINQIQVDEYQYAAWKHQAEDSAVMVLHGLAVDPLEKIKGMARRSSHSMKSMGNTIAVPHCACIQMCGIQGHAICISGWATKKSALWHVSLTAFPMCS